MKPKLLVVDDDPDIRKTISMALGEDYVVMEASDGEEALSVIKKERPRLVLLDVSMPKMGGIEALQAARSIDPALTVIMLTSEGDMGVAKRALEGGAVEYITKPFDLGNLRSNVRRLLGPGQSGKETPPWRVAP